MKKNKTIRYEVFTDGACSGNPGPGGYAFVLISKEEHPLVVSGHKDKTTNNQMELTAIVRALKHICTRRNEEIEVVIFSDSAYCVNSITNGYIYQWQKNEWKTKAGYDVKNKELWEQFLEIKEDHPRMKLKLFKVKGHSGNTYNEMADKAAKRAVNKG